MVPPTVGAGFHGREILGRCDFSSESERTNAEFPMDRANVLLLDDILFAVGNLNMRDLVQHTGVKFHHFFIGDPVQVEMIEDLFTLFNHDSNRRIAPDSVQGCTTVIQCNCSRLALFVSRWFSGLQAPEAIQDKADRQCEQDQNCQ